MESQNAQGQNQQGQQQYCSTPIMAPPSSPAPQSMQHQSIHQPPLSNSPAPHHSGYYNHHPQYQTPVQSQPHSYYQNYYPQQQSHNQPQAQPSHYQHQQQWGHPGHHSYYQAQSVAATQQPSNYQTDSYPSQTQTPYQYVQQQLQHHRLIPPPGSSAPRQPQPQHALMNLSRFVSQQTQSPCPSPGPSRSSTTPVPLNSPHYLPPHSPGLGHMVSQPSSFHQPQPQMLQTNNVHSSFHPPVPVSHHSPNMTQDNVESHNMNNAHCHPVALNNRSSSSATSEQVQNSSNEISSTNPGKNISNGGRSESNSPSSVSSSRILSSPPPPILNPNPTVSSSNSSNNGHMIPVRLQNMQTGARTKASMRKLMQEQQISTSTGNISCGSGTEEQEGNNAVSDNEISLPGKRTTSPKKTTKSPKKSKKGALEFSPSNSNTEDSPVSNPKTQAEPLLVVTPGYSRKGKKMGRPSKPKSLAGGSETESPKKKGRKTAAATTETNEQLEPPPAIQEPLVTHSPKDGGKKKQTPVLVPAPEVSIPDSNEDDIIQNEDQATPKTKRKYVRKAAKTSRKKPVLKPVPEPLAEPVQEPEPVIQPEEPMETVDEPIIEEFETPTRAIRRRAAKETQKKTESKSPSDRSRQPRSTRGSANKEKSPSRSKSPTGSPKKSPSPSKRLSLDIASPSPTRNSPGSTIKSPKSRKSNETIAKSSPRLKEASPSPVRVRQLKEKTPSPLQNKRETRGSRERDDTPTPTPKKASRKANKKTPETTALHVEVPEPEPEPEVKTPNSPKKKAASRKSKKDTSPVRMSSPRLLAKELIVVAPAESTREQSPTTPEPTEVVSKPVKAKRVYKRKPTTPARSRAANKAKQTVVKAKKRKSLESNDSIEKEISVAPKKKPRLSKPNRQRKRAPKRRSIEQSTPVADNILISPLISNANAPPSAECSINNASDITNTPAEVSSLSINQDIELVVMDLSVPPITPTPIVIQKPEFGAADSGIPVKSPAKKARRKSKAERQSTEIQAPISNENTAQSQSENETAVLQKDANSSSTQVNLSPNVVPFVVSTSESGNLSRPVNTSYEPAQQMLPNFNPVIPSSSSTAAITKPKKPRKPRILKPKMSLTDSKSIGGEVVPRKKTKLELNLEFQQRKANLEVEVAQALLDMKHNSNSPSLVKLLESTVGEIETSQETVESQPLPPSQTKVAKPKSRPQKRKLSGVELNFERPITPTTSPIFPSYATLSPDIASPLISKPKSKRTPKKPRMKSETITLTSTPPLPPTILAVPQINGSQMNFSANSSISFQNTPNRTGPIKVSKTIIPPSTEIPERRTSTLADIELTIANVSSGAVFDDIFNPSPIAAIPKPKRKKITKAKIQVSSETPGNSEIIVKEKPKRIRKKVPKKPKAEATSTGESIVTNEVAQVAADGPLDMTFPPATGQPAKKRRERKKDASEPKPKRKRISTAKPRPFKFVSRPMPVPTIFTTTTIPLQFSNGIPIGATILDKAKIIGPSLKVGQGGQVEFYRAGEREEIDSDPSQPKRVQPEFDDSVPWLCCFCNLGAHIQKMGDLFGPYAAEKITGSGKNRTVVKKETWMHGECAMWAGGMTMAGTLINGLETAIVHASRASCTTCGQGGATIGCQKRFCQQSVHLPCALRKSWSLDVEGFQSYCPAHVP